MLWFEHASIYTHCLEHILLIVITVVYRPQNIPLTFTKPIRLCIKEGREPPGPRSSNLRS